jgi:hypothetical protein
MDAEEKNAYLNTKRTYTYTNINKRAKNYEKKLKQHARAKITKMS